MNLESVLWEIIQNSFLLHNFILVVVFYPQISKLEQSLEDYKESYEKLKYSSEQVCPQYVS